MIESTRRSLVLLCTATLTLAAAACDDGSPADSDGDTTTTLPDSDIVEPVEPIGVPVAGATLTGLQGAVVTHAVDFTGDGLPDLVGLTAEGELVLAARGRDPVTPGELPTFSPAASIPLGDLEATLLEHGDFNGDQLQDLVVWDVAAGRVGFLLNTGAAFDNPIIAFDNPIIAFDNPIIAFDNPIIAFDNPIIANEASWAVGDFDGDGRAEVAFALGEAGLAVLWTGSAAASDATSLAPSLEQPAGLGEFDNPIIAVPHFIDAADIDANGTAELIVGFDLPEHAGTDGVALFSHAGARTFDNPIIAFDNPIIAFDNPIIAVEGDLVSLTAGNLDADNSADVAWLARSASDASLTGGVWRSNGFDNPIIATAPQTFGLGAEGSTGFDNPIIAMGRLVSGLGGQGSGGSGADALALLPARGHIFIVPGRDDAASATVALAVLPQAIATRTQRLDGDAAGGRPVDLDGDGFSEFVQPVANGLVVAAQTALTDRLRDILLENGTRLPLCEVAAPFCDQGALGVCQFARNTCGECTAIAAFERFLPGVSLEDVLEESETLCDGLDNDCDGVVDRLGRVALPLSTLLGSTPAAFEAAPLGEGLLVVGASEVGAPLGYLVLSDADDATAAASGTLSLVAGDRLEVASDGRKVALLGVDAEGVTWLATVPASGEVLETPVSLPRETRVALGADNAVAFGLEGGRMLLWQGSQQLMGSAPLEQGEHVLRAAFGFDSGTAAVTTVESSASDSVSLVVTWLDAQGELREQTPQLELPLSGRVEEIVAQGGAEHVVLVLSGAFSDGSTLQLVRVSVTGANAYALDARPLELSRAPLVAGTLALHGAEVAANGPWQVTWLETPDATTGQAVIREALIERGRVLRAQNLGTTVLGAVAPARVVALADGTLRVLLVPADGDGTIESMRLCGP